jgi:hypothetical protein
MRYRAIITAAIVAAALLLSAAAVHAQSIFSLNYLGEHRFRGGARHRGLAFSTIAVPDSSGAITQNTATLADLDEVTFSILEVMGLSRIRTEEESVDQNRFQLPTVVVAVPLRRGLVFSLGYRTRFEGRGDFSFRRSVPGVSNPLEVYKQRSTLFTAPLALSWKVHERINVAAELQIERGTLGDEVTVYFPEDEDFGVVQSRRDRNFSGTSWSGSILLMVHPRLTIGALFDDRVDYSVDEQVSFTRTDLDSSVSYTYELPFAYGVGVAAGLSERWWLTSSFWMREKPESTGFEQLDDSLRDEWLLAFGIERKRGMENGYLSRMPFRLGYYENRYHLEFPAGETITARFVTLGTGLSFPGSPGNLDLSIELGQIGSLDGNGIDERVIRIGVGLNVSESWSRRKPGRR